MNSEQCWWVQSAMFLKTGVGTHRTFPPTTANYISPHQNKKNNPLYQMQNANANATTHVPCLDVATIYWRPHVHHRSFPLPNHTQIEKDNLTCPAVCSFGQVVTSQKNKDQKKRERSDILRSFLYILLLQRSLNPTESPNGGLSMRCYY